MLGNEDRMAPHRRLPAVVRGLGGREPRPDEILRMAPDGLQPFGFEIGAVTG